MTVIREMPAKSFSDMLSLIKSQTGILALNDSAEELKLCLHLSGEQVRAVFVNGRPLRCGEEARCLLIKQLREDPRDVRFAQALPEDLRKGLAIPVGELLAEVGGSGSAAPQQKLGFFSGAFQKTRQRFAKSSSPS